MSEARALTNFAGNAVATVLIGSWTKELDRERMSRVLSGQKPFNEAALVDDHAASSSNEAGEAPTRV
jgi:aerobic C4-dicarboxylate transport protein